ESGCGQHGEGGRLQAQDNRMRHSHVQVELLAPAAGRTLDLRQRALEPARAAAHLAPAEVLGVLGQSSRPVADLALADLGLAADLPAAMAQATAGLADGVVLTGDGIGDHRADLAGTPAGRAFALGNQLDIAGATTGLAPPAADDLAVPGPVAGRAV